MTFEELMDCCYISDSDCNRYSYAQLLNAFRKNNVIPVIGAGMSCWAYPLWGRMLTDRAEEYGVRDEVEALLRDNKYEEAASCLEEVCTHNGLSRILSHTFRPELAYEKAGSMPDYLRLFPNLFHGPIVTTNFDRVIEFIFEKEGAAVPDLVTPLDDFQSGRISSALRTMNPIIVKMHGDINDREHLVLTKESYDSIYGVGHDSPDYEKPMPKFLRDLLERKPLLFLGCGLSADRTCSVIRDCAGNGQQFALLELPAETFNAAQPLKPTFRDGGKKFIESFRRRREDIVGRLNIIPIWYPHGMHDEAYQALFKKLAADLGLVSPKREPEGDSYIPLHRLFGREKIVRDIFDALSQGDTNCIWVEGTGGIGKTEICKAVYRQLAVRDPDLTSPYVDLADVRNLYGFFDAVISGAGLHTSMELGGEDIGDLVFRDFMDKYPPRSGVQPGRMIYFDNWEDVWYGLAHSAEDRRRLLAWMRRLSSGGVKLMVSSREIPHPIAGEKVFRVEPLDKGRLETGCNGPEFEELDSVKLFESILGRTAESWEQGAFQSLISQLEGHPLAIVLTATQARSEISLPDILTRWDRAKQDTGDTNEKHTSMDIALKVSWDAIQDSRAAVIQWGLHYLSLKPIPRDVLDGLRGEDPEDAWDEGSRALNGANLTYPAQERRAVAMLLPLKKQFPALAGDGGVIAGECLFRWASCLTDIFQKAAQFTNGDRLKWHQTAVELAPQALYIMERLMDVDTDRSIALLRRLAVLAGNHYQFCTQSLDFLEGLTEYLKCHEPSEDFAYIMMDYGRVLVLTDNISKAESVYSIASGLFELSGNRHGIADIMHAKGYMLFQEGLLKDALENYMPALSIYDSLNDRMSVANIAQAIGEILCRLEDADTALKIFELTEPIFRKEGDGLGLANLMLCRGEALMLQEKHSDAMAAFVEAEGLYRQEMDDIGYANVLLSEGELFYLEGDTERAERLYKEAEPMFLAAHDDLGLANAWYSLGDIDMRKEDYVHAGELYCKAAGQYKKLKETNGLARVLSDLCCCLERMGESGEADTARSQALELIESDTVLPGTRKFVLAKLKISPQPAG